MFKEDRLKLAKFLLRYNAITLFVAPLTNVSVSEKGYDVDVDVAGKVHSYEIAKDGQYVKHVEDYGFPVQFLDAYLYKLAVDVYDLMAEDLSAIGSLIGREEEVSDA